MSWSPMCRWLAGPHMWHLQGAFPPKLCRSTCSLLSTNRTPPPEPTRGLGSGRHPASSFPHPSSSPDLATLCSRIPLSRLWPLCLDSPKLQVLCISLLPPHFLLRPADFFHIFAGIVGIYPSSGAASSIPSVGASFITPSCEKYLTPQPMSPDHFL